MRPSDPELVILGVNRLLALARNAKDPASTAAGKILALIEALIAADCEKLCEANEAFKLERQWLGKSLRDDVWFPAGSPASPLYQALHCELMHCYYYRGENHDLLGALKWGAQEYQALMKLPPLSVESLKDWERELWKLLKKHNPDLRAELRRRASRQEIVWTYSDGSSKRQVKSRKLSWKDFRGQFHNHLKTVAEAWGSTSQPRTTSLSG